MTECRSEPRTSVRADIPFHLATIEDDLIRRGIIPDESVPTTLLALDDHDSDHRIADLDTPPEFGSLGRFDL
jgi:hypothetical protein